MARLDVEIAHLIFVNTLSNILRQPEMATWTAGKHSLCFLYEISSSYLMYTSMAVVECAFTDVESPIEVVWAPSLQYPQKSLMVTWTTVNPSYSVRNQQFPKPRNGTLNCCKHPIPHYQTTRNGDMNCWQILLMLFASNIIRNLYMVT